MRPAISGKFVRHSDYAALSAQLEAATKRADTDHAQGKAEGLREAAASARSWGTITQDEYDLDGTQWNFDLPDQIATRILALIPADTPAEPVDWDDIPDTPEQRALIAAHNSEMKRAYPNLIDLDSLSAQLAECEARLLKVTAEREEENLKFQMANTAWDQETATRKVAEAQSHADAAHWANTALGDLIGGK
jgi:hypothetical protein